MKTMQSKPITYTRATLPDAKSVVYEDAATQLVILIEPDGTHKEIRAIGGVWKLVETNTTLSGQAQQSGTAPSFSSPPTVTGTPTAGQAATYSNGTASGNPTPTLSGVFLLDDVSQGASFTPADGDAGKTLKYRQTATNGVGSPATSTSAGVVIAAAQGQADARPRFGYGNATAGVAGPQALFDTMTPFGTSGSVSGTFTTAPPSGQYAWAAFPSTASANGVHFNVTLGPGGWQGASSSGQIDDGGVDPNTSVVVWTDTRTGLVWRFFRSSSINAADAWTTTPGP